MSCMRELARDAADLVIFKGNLVSSENVVSGLVINDNFDATSTISSMNVFSVFAAILADDIWAEVLGGLSVMANRNNNYKKTIN